MSGQPFVSNPPDEALIVPIARRLARRYQHVECEDVAQELRLWWLANPDKVQRFPPDHEIGRKQLGLCLKRAGNKFCLKETRQRQDPPLDEVPVPWDYAGPGARSAMSNAAGIAAARRESGGGFDVFG